ncbi:hypothetical protein [Malaciobacter marinus]|nr:hypothetical protein [Malaciobacter marinus]
MEKQTESDFINSIINVANEINGHTITSEQKDLIIKKFNELEGTSFERAKKSIENVINKDISKYELVQEDSAASMNN